VTIHPDAPRTAPPTEATRGRRSGLPPEIAATILALSAVLGAVAFQVPAFGIFFGWAAATLNSGIPRARRSTLAVCLVVGAAFGTGTLVAQAALLPLLGDTVPDWVGTVVALAIANPLMIALGRVPRFGSVPGMFIGFSTVLAIHLGGLAPVADSPVTSFLVAVATTLVGVSFLWVYGWMTRAAALDPASQGARRRQPRMRA